MSLLNDILNTAFNFLDPYNLLKASEVCKKWNGLAKAKERWYELLISHFAFRKDQINQIENPINIFRQNWCLQNNLIKNNPKLKFTSLIADKRCMTSAHNYVLSCPVRHEDRTSLVAYNILTNETNEILFPFFEVEKESLKYLKNDVFIYHREDNGIIFHLGKKDSSYISGGAITPLNDRYCMIVGDSSCEIFDTVQYNYRPLKPFVKENQFKMVGDLFFIYCTQKNYIECFQFSSFEFKYCLPFIPFELFDFEVVETYLIVCEIKNTEFYVYRHPFAIFDTLNGKKLYDFALIPKLEQQNIFKDYVISTHSQHRNFIHRLLNLNSIDTGTKLLNYLLKVDDIVFNEIAKSLFEDFHPELLGIMFSNGTEGLTELLGRLYSLDLKEISKKICEALYTSQIYFKSDSSKLLPLVTNEVVELFDLETMKRILKIPLRQYKEQGSRLNFLIHRNRLALTIDIRKLFLWDISTQRQIAEYESPSLLNIRFENNLLIIVDLFSKILKIFEIAKGTLLYSQTVEPFPTFFKEGKLYCNHEGKLLIKDFSVI